MNRIRGSRAALLSLLAVPAIVFAQAAEPDAGQQDARPDWRARQRGGRGTVGGPRRGGDGTLRPDARMKELFEKLREQDPERFERLATLRETDPEAFHKEIREVMQQRFKGRRPGVAESMEQKCAELGDVYRRTTDEKARQRIRAELGTAVEEAFDARVKERLQRLERMEQEIQRIRREIEARKGNREEICKRRVDDLTQDPEHRWDW